MNYNLNISVRYKYFLDPEVTEKLDTLQQEVITEYQGFFFAFIQYTGKIRNKNKKKFKTFENTYFVSHFFVCKSKI